MTPFDFLRKKPLPDFFSSITRHLIFSIIIGGFLLLPSISWAATLYAKQHDVKVTAEKSPTSAVVTMLTLGEPVTVLSESGRLAKVKTAKGKTGWVFTFRLSSSKPIAKSGSGLSGLAGKRTIAARESRAGGSIRGLKESTEQYAKDKQIKQEHRDAVDRMESFSVTSDELMKFKKAGNLGEFSGGAQ